MLLRYWTVSAALSFSIGLQAAGAQGISEMRGLSALSAGAGAGVASAVAGTGEASVDGIKQMNAPTAAQIANYNKLGQQFANEQRWNDAERCYRFCLTNIAKTSGPGSPKLMPILEKLTEICRKQRKNKEALGYYKSVVSMKLAETHNVNSANIIKAKQKLSDLYISAGEYENAVVPLAEAAKSAQAPGSDFPKEQLLPLLTSYSTVLRELDRKSEAREVEAREAELRGEASTAATPSSETGRKEP